MFAIVAHHIYTYSLIPFEFESIDIYLFNGLFNGFSKAGCLGFILITGYFMIDREFKPSNILKLAVEIWFYNWVINILLIATGKLEFSWEILYNTMFPIILIEFWFLTYYIIIMLLSPVVNKALNSISKGQYRLLLIIMIIVSFILPTMIHRSEFTELLILLTGYCIGGYLKLYPSAVSNSIKFGISTFAATIVSFIIIMICTFYFMHGGYIVLEDDKFLFFIIYLLASVIILTLSFHLGSVKIMTATVLMVVLFGNLINILFNGYETVNMENHPWNGLMMMSAVSLFLVFINMKPRDIRWINFLSASVLAIYIIHFQMYLREHIIERIDLISWVGSDWYPAYALASVIAVMAACLLIDIARRELFRGIYQLMHEKIDNISNRVDEAYLRLIE